MVGLVKKVKRNLRSYVGQLYSKLSFVDALKEWAYVTT